MRIAICDDSKEDYGRIHSMLKQLEPEDSRFYIENFEDGSDLVNAYRSGKRYDLIFLDIVMNKMDGFHTANIIRSLDKEVMLVFETSVVGFIMRAFDFQANGYLIKPVKHKNIEEILLKAGKRMIDQQENLLVLQN